MLCEVSQTQKDKHRFKLSNIWSLDFKIYLKNERRRDHLGE